jgi:hypothetical protein
MYNSPSKKKKNRLFPKKVDQRKRRPIKKTTNLKEELTDWVKPI